MSEYIFSNPDKYARAIANAGGDTDVDKVIEEYVKLGGRYTEDGEFKNIIGSPVLSNPVRPDEATIAERVKKVDKEGKKEDKTTNPPTRAVPAKPKLTKNAKK